MKKFMLRVVPILFVAMLVMTTTFAATTDVNSLYSTGTSASSITGVASNIWSTILTVLQICAIAAVVFAGVRYMFAGADQKAEIKNGLIVLVIGAVLVFGASTVINLIITATEQV